jgi:hypothetical protein
MLAKPHLIYAFKLLIYISYILGNRNSMLISKKNRVAGYMSKVILGTILNIVTAPGRL